MAKFSDSQRKCTIIARMLTGTGLLCVGLGRMLDGSAGSPAAEFVCGFGFGLLLTSALRGVWRRRRAKAHCGRKD